MSSSIPKHMLDWAKPSTSWASVDAAQREIDKISAKILELPIAELRQIGYRAPPLPPDVPEPGRDIDISTIEIAVTDGTKIPLRIYKAKVAGAGSPLFFNIHGGGWVMGVPETEEAQSRIIALKNKAVVASVDYRKAPEFPYPIPLNDCYDVFQWCLENSASLGVNPRKIIVGGGSAGANLTAALLFKLRAHDATMDILGQILNIPVTCHPQRFPKERFAYFSYTQNAASPIVDSGKMDWFWNQYLSSSTDGDLFSSPTVSPLLASDKATQGLPPTLIQVAGMDPLRDEGLAYAEALKANRVPVTVKVYSGLPHAFYIHPNLQETSEYFQTMVDWINQLLGERSTL
ncbi:hypothetical protein CLAIMM_03152 [Cladophialophora immunda]|nr:hypothetical protein CLAIMM_03152 [Cladophialophora immunda]